MTLDDPFYPLDEATNAAADRSPPAARRSGSAARSPRGFALVAASSPTAGSSRRSRRQVPDDMTISVIGGRRSWRELEAIGRDPADVRVRRPSSRPGRQRPIAPRRPRDWPARFAAAGATHVILGMPARLGPDGLTAVAREVADSGPRSADARPALASALGGAAGGGWDPDRHHDDVTEPTAPPRPAPLPTEPSEADPPASDPLLDAIQPHPGATVPWPPAKDQRGLAAPYPPGGLDPQPDAGLIEERHYLRLLIADGRADRRSAASRSASSGCCSASRAAQADRGRVDRPAGERRSRSVRTGLRHGPGRRTASRRPTGTARTLSSSTHAPRR